MRLFAIVDEQVWANAVTAGTYRPPSLASEGFVHCSFADQVAGTAARWFGDVGGLIVVELDSATVPEVRIEDSYGRGQSFPHIYGAVPTAAAVAVWPLTRFTSESAAASTDR